MAVDLNFLENGVLKARYIAINTPESTGSIEPWGKKAANFTKTKLQSDFRPMRKISDCEGSKSKKSLFI